ncbi:NAD(P)/FAD-dependent oxidoreductase [Nocardia bovistercoris]|uniref:FAD-dependent oxidoreductase n=1 Tax=Nocardia bovistercoris TaxID=2785916 RepID=A0A931IBW6_9NOCA|nr:FAD-dependent oxidoreductase [Nocardia bovistercoris]MBH0778211.1 FAD-dependent oxidoreductase [Nocardia bovistercoris]
MSAEHRIVVLGAGYGGLAAALRLARGRGVRVTVVDSRAEFVERVRLHQRAAGQSIPRWDLRERLSGKGIHFERARVRGIDLDAKRVDLEPVAPDGETAIDYDTLVYALGSGFDPAGVPGVVRYAVSVATPEDVREPRGSVAIVGGGATGIELAAELAESRPGSRVTLLSSEEPGGWMSPRAAAHVRRALERLGVEIRSGAKVVEVLADGVRLADGSVVAADTTVWTTGFGVPRVAAESGLAVDAHGRVRTDASLRSVSHPDVYAIGDSAVLPGRGGRELRMACATAIPSGGYAARAIAARLRGHEPRDFDFRYVAQCVSLGRRDGVIQLLRADDSPARTVLTGRLGARAKELVVLGAGWSVRP